MRKSGMKIVEDFEGAIRHQERMRQKASIGDWTKHALLLKRLRQELIEVCDYSKDEEI